FFSRLLKHCEEEIKKRRPQVIILVDYPGFNLRLAKRVKSLGIPIIYYISPQVWAWGKRRVKIIREVVDLMLLILPFEEKFFASHGLNCHFVGHYLLEEIPEEYISSPIPPQTQIALLPGSRKQEIELMLPSMLETAKRFNNKYSTKAVVAGIKELFDYDKYLKNYSEDNITISYDNTYKTIYDSRLVLTASGTATLETAIIGRPMVVVYKTGFLTYWIARYLLKLDKIALVNLTLNEKVVPELIQYDANAKKMFLELEKFYNNARYFEAVKKRLGQVPQLLGGKGASERAAQLIYEFLNL
ncbi:MAG: lipid-A-disaccharide synthase, partial [FCB group bacterium]|nr:lipid-A-disaccharide synthase [FCB group bacterium]